MEENIIENIHRVFDIEEAELKKVQNSLNDSIVDVVHVLDSCKGKVVLCGMGKPGHIGRKISATMSSLGIESYFLHPAEAAHGDLGTLSAGDVIIIISNSGETGEIVRMLPNIKMIGTAIVAITSHRNSTLALYADYLLELPEINEACSLSLAPTSSTTAALVIGDALAVTVSGLRGFQKENFALYHPAGALGRKLITRVKDLMYSGDDNPTISEHGALIDAIIKMTDTGHGAISIVDDAGKLKGIITDGDLKRYIKGKLDIYHATVNEIMTREAVFVNQDLLAVEALKIMEQGEKQISVLPVVDNQELVVGMISNHDIIKLGIF